MIDFSTGIAVITTHLDALKTIASGLIDLRDAHKLATIKADLSDRVLKAQAELAQILAAVVEKDTRIALLEKRVRDLEQKQLNRERYELRELTVGGNTFAYRLKPPSALAEDAGEVPHFVCQPCLDRSGIKSVLQGRDVFGVMDWECPVCKSHLTGATTGTPQIF